ncbi:MAG: stage V sporulation protein AD [Firmicutes bacterium]|nr:stage V sporulation protein AD [Oscillospiraceae bacterium]MBS5433528.1 stage V sporulation protein AD [Bacillota bacterium]
MYKRLGKQTVKLQNPPAILSYAAVAGKKEGEGPLKACFDYISDDSYFGEKTWEKAESHMIKQCFSVACDKGKIAPSALDYIFAGDLLNQCVSSAFAMKDSHVPYFGLYGACSTMAESLSLAAMTIDGGYANTVCALTGSHFCSAERQYRFPLEYGGQRPPTAQWTVTGAGAVILGSSGQGMKITHVTTGSINDAGINDANNMGSAMAPAAYDTLKAHFADTGRTPDYYDAIFTGDLGALGHDILQALFKADGVELGPRYMDCGVLMFDLNAQEVFCGGSGCGCCASVLGGHILRGMEKGVWRRILLAATGALMSPTSSQQGDSIPGICHAVAIEKEG